MVRGLVEINGIHVGAFGFVFVRGSFTTSPASELRTSVEGFAVRLATAFNHLDAALANGGVAHRVTRNVMKPNIVANKKEKTTSDVESKSFLGFDANIVMLKMNESSPQPMEW
jgi:hypothetical protein